MPSAAGHAPDSSLDPGLLVDVQLCSCAFVMSSPCLRGSCKGIALLHLLPSCWKLLPQGGQLQAEILSRFNLRSAGTSVVHSNIMMSWCKPATLQPAPCTSTPQNYSAAVGALCLAGKLRPGSDAAVCKHYEILQYCNVCYPGPRLSLPWILQTCQKYCKRPQLGREPGHM